jgi:hypothetical protein
MFEQRRSRIEPLPNTIKQRSGHSRSSETLNNTRTTKLIERGMFTALKVLHRARYRPPGFRKRCEEGLQRGVWWVLR